MKEPEIDTDQLARAVWLDPETVGSDEVRESCSNWAPLVKELHSFAVNRYGTRNNNWAKIIPLVIHSLANDITASIVSLDDTPVIGEPYQVNLFQELFPNQEELIEEVEEGTPEEVIAAQAKRYSDLFGEKEFMDPFWVDVQEERKEKKKAEEGDTDPDLLM